MGLLGIYLILIFIVVVLLVIVWLLLKVAKLIESGNRTGKESFTLIGAIDRNTYRRPSKKYNG